MSIGRGVNDRETLIGHKVIFVCFQPDFLRNFPMNGRVYVSVERLGMTFGKGNVPESHLLQKGFSVIKENSPIGTFLNAQKIAEPLDLDIGQADGDEVIVQASVSFFKPFKKSWEILR